MIDKSVFYYHKELTDDEKRVIQDKREIPIFSIIYDVPCNDLLEATRNLKVKKEHLKTYLENERGWISFFNDCFEKKNGFNHPSPDDNSPEACEIRIRETTELCKSHLMNVYSLYYLYKHPDRMNVPLGNVFLDKVITDFLVLKTYSH